MCMGVNNDGNNIEAAVLKVFETIPDHYIILSAELVVLTASNACLQAIHQTRNEITGKLLFEIFSLDSFVPQEVDLEVYFEKLMIERRPQELPVIRYDIVDPADSLTKTYYWKVSHTPVLDEKGDVLYIIHHAADRTIEVLSKKRAENNRFTLLLLNQELELADHEIQLTIDELKVSNNELHSAEEKLQHLNAELEELEVLRKTELLEVQAEVERQRGGLEKFFMQSPMGICVLDGPDLVFELINPPYQQLFPGRDLIAKKILDAVPEIKGQPIWDILQNVYQTGKMFAGESLLIPLARNDNGPIEDRYFNFIYQARLDGNGKTDGILVFVFEVTNMVIAEKQAEVSEKRFGFLLNAMPQQVWTAKPDGTIDYINEVICNELNIKTSMFSKRWYEYVHPDDRVDCRKKWQHALETGDEYMVEVRLKMQDGQYKWHLGRAIPLIEDGQVKLWVGTNTNIDLQKNNEQKKDEFLSVASHELKTPLTSIKAFNQLMKRTNDLVKVSTFVKKSEENIHRLERLIADLLDVTKINAGKMVYNMQEFSFMQMLMESVENVQHINSSHRFILEQADDIRYTGDRFRIEQVVNNFLSNAVKYSPNADKVIVKCKVELNNIILSVQDFGIGIASHELNRLFERYYRGDNTAMRFEGLGLGLFISSEILKGHEGSFWIESELEKGSTFYFRLPLTIFTDVIPLIDPERFYQDETLTIILNQQQLEIDWTGFQNFESVQNGCIRIHEMLVKNKVSKIRNDNRGVLGTWAEAAEWVGLEWMPLMEKEGLRHLAWINSPSSFSRVAAEKTLDVAIGSIITRLFPDISTAQEWLDHT